MKDEVRIYRAGDSDNSLFTSLREAARDLASARLVIWRLFVRDFTVQFRQKLLGYFWVVLAPLIAIASFVFMVQTGFLRPGEITVPYPLFVFVGTGLWGIMVATLTTISGGLLSNGDLLIRTSVPAIGLAVAGLAGLAYNALVHTVVLLLILLVAGYPPSLWIVAYPLMMLPLVMLGAGVGLLLSAIGAVARDLTAMVVAALGLAMYVTPVIYDARFDSPVLAAIVRLNPLTYLVSFPRDVIFTGTSSAALGFALSSLFAMVILVLGVHAFYLIKDKATERL